MRRILLVNGSPTTGSSTEILLDMVVQGFRERTHGYEVVVEQVVLNSLTFIPCQACGKAPTPAFCFYDDALTPVYRQIAQCDAFVIGTPIYFDSVSAQTKGFIDRCNCFRPPDYERRNPEHHFVKVLSRKRPGGIVLVGGRDAWFEGARRTIAGFFKWIEIANEGMVTYRSIDFNEMGTAREDSSALTEARDLGGRIALQVDHE